MMVAIHQTSCSTHRSHLTYLTHKNDHCLLQLSRWKHLRTSMDVHRYVVRAPRLFATQDQWLHVILYLGTFHRP